MRSSAILARLGPEAVEATRLDDWPPGLLERLRFEQYVEALEEQLYVEVEELRQRMILVLNGTFPKGHRRFHVIGPRPYFDWPYGTRLALNARGRLVLAKQCGQCGRWIDVALEHDDVLRSLHDRQESAVGLAAQSVEALGHRCERREW